MNLVDIGEKCDRLFRTAQRDDQRKQVNKFYTPIKKTVINNFDDDHTLIIDLVTIPVLSTDGYVIIYHFVSLKTRQKTCLFVFDYVLTLL